MSRTDKYDTAPPQPGGALYRWALGPGRAAYFAQSGEDAWLPVLVELDGVSVAEFASGTSFFSDKERISAWQLSVRVDPLIEKYADFLKQLNFVTALVREEFFDLLDEPENERLRMAIPFVSLGPPLRDGDSAGDVKTAARRRPNTSSSQPLSGSAVAADGSEAAAENGPGPVIVGIIDDGIAFANERFRNGNRTRVQYLWLQRSGTASPLLLLGRELQASAGAPQDNIDANIAAATNSGAIDEGEVYQRMRVLDFARREHHSLGYSATHGTAVMDIATGYPADEAQDERPIIAVQLPTEEIKDTSLNGLEPYIFMAVFYILVRAFAVAEHYGAARLPVVINLSFGNIAGPHDGTSWLERAIQALVEIWRAAGWRVEIVLPSGNNHLSRCHAQVRFDSAPDSIELPWRVQPDDRTASYLQIWLPFTLAPPAADRVRVRVVAPGGTPPANATAWLGEDSGAPPADYPPTGDVWCRVSYTYMPLPTARGVFEIFLQPTGLADPNVGAPLPPTAPSGLWIVEIENLGLRPFEPLEAWIQRDDTPFTYARLGRQSYFDAECYRRFDAGGHPLDTDDPNCFVKRDGTINAIATGRDPIVIGGVLRKERLPAPYSSGGPVTNPATEPLTRDGPDALAVSDDSMVHNGVLATGARSGSIFALSGTSIAAPRITRWVASQQAGNNAAGRMAVANLATQLELGYPPVPSKPSLTRGGAGRILLRPVYNLARFWPWP
jgi:hypothetical protein